MRFSKYNLVVEMDYGLLLYNSRQAGIVQIHNEEELYKFRNLLKTNLFNKDDEMVKALYQRGFIVDDGIDEYEEAKKDVERYYDGFKDALEIQLCVTENCNFRCDYCFEEHLDKKFSEEHWDALYRHIEKNLEKEKYKFIQIDFFGGEPLLELKSIIKFLDKLQLLKTKYPNVVFQHHMTTNGYLLTPDVYDKLIARDVCLYMVTVDGFAETHNITRPLVGGGKTWDKIIENLKYINNKNEPILMDFRVNINKLNSNNIQEFVDWVKQSFDMKKFRLYLNYATKFSDHSGEKYILKEVPDDLSEFVYNNNVGMADVRFSVLKKSGCACHCAEKSFYSMSVDGKISKCEQDCNDNFCSLGELTKNGDFVFNSNMEKWESNWETEYCKDCIHYPLCSGRRCPSQKFYSGEKREDCFYKDENPPSDKKIREWMSKYLSIKFSEIKKQTNK